MDTFLAPFADLHVLRPQWLWALLAMPLLGWWWRRRRLRASAWRNAVDPHLLPHLLDAGAGRRGRLGWLAAACAYALAVLALSGPSWRQVAQPSWQAPAPLVVALDLSSAALAADLPPSRLLQARAKIAALLGARQGGQVGLVAYAGDAFTVAPLTDDVANVALFLDALDPSVMPVDGQRADRAIEWSVRLLRQAGFDRGDILMLADHADAHAIAAATAARAEGYRVSALGVGTAAGSAYRDPAGGISHARLDADSLQALAGAGGGTYAPLARDASDLHALGVLDPRLAGVDRQLGDARTRHWQDGGFWLLPPLMLLALLAFRRGAPAVMLVLVLWWPGRVAASDLWQRPDQRAYQQMQQAAEAYRNGDFDDAAERYAQVEGADADYNRGNALAKAGHYPQAIEAYEEALRQDPGMEDAIANKRAVEAAMNRQPPQGPQSGQQDGDDDSQQPGDGQGSPGAGQPSGAGGDSDADDRAPPPAGRPDDASADKPSERDSDTPPPAAEAQSAADEAQREQMRKALQDATQPPAEEGETPAEAIETPEQRERRLANEAWLRRIPDDPGGLLREKFRLEHQRRQMQQGWEPR